MIWFLLFGPFAQALTGAMALWQNGDARYLETLSAYTRFPVIFLLLGLFDIAWGKRVLGGLTLAYAAAVAWAGPAVVAVFTGAMCAAFWATVAMWLRAKPGFRALATASVLLLLGFVIFDLAFDLPFVLFGAQQELSLLNNTVHVGKLVHAVWLPIAMLGASIGVGHGVIKDRTLYDFSLAALFLGGGALLFLIIQPKEIAVANGETQHLLTVGISHVISFVAIVAALVLLRLKDPSNRSGRP